MVYLVGVSIQMSSEYQYQSSGRSKSLASPSAFRGLSPQGTREGEMTESHQSTGYLGLKEMSPTTPQGTWGLKGLSPASPRGT